MPLLNNITLHLFAKKREVNVAIEGTVREGSVCEGIVCDDE